PALASESYVEPMGYVAPASPLRQTDELSRLARISVDVIIARGLTIAAARQATNRIPIVMAADPDPVRSGFVVSLARPGGTITGLSTLAPDLEAKQLELLRETLPSLARVGVLANANSPKTEETTRLEAQTRAPHPALTY